MANNLKLKTPLDKTRDKQNSDKPVRQAQGKPAASMAELMAKAGSSLQILQKGQAVEGTIKKLTPQEILMDIGAKGDALVIEFDKQNLGNLLANLKVGDAVVATVISPESEEGFPVVSLRRTLDDIIFKKLEDLASHDEAFEVEVAEATRGGHFVITPLGVRGFLPASQILPAGLSLGGPSSQALSKTLIPGAKIKVKILEYDRPKKRVVFSQKATFFVTNINSIKALIKPGDITSAEITEVVPYGLFAVIEKEGTRTSQAQRIEGPALSERKRVEGFVHISEVSYSRVENLGASYKVGDKIKAQVLEIDAANRRVNLSIKKTLTDVFANIRDKYKTEDRIQGKVTKVASRGITLRILSPRSDSGQAGQALTIEEASGPEGLRTGGGINGFIPSDKVPADAKTMAGKPSGYNVGDTIECVVVDFDDRRRVIILSPILKAVPIGYR